MLMITHKDHSLMSRSISGDLHHVPHKRAGHTPLTSKAMRQQQEIMMVDATSAFVNVVKLKRVKATVSARGTQAPMRRHPMHLLDIDPVCLLPCIYLPALILSPVVALPSPLFPPLLDLWLTPS